MYRLDNDTRRQAPPVTVPSGAMPATDVAWKRALKGVAAAALRLHRYRFIRTRMLHDALGAVRETVKPGESGR